MNNLYIHWLSTGVGVLREYNYVLIDNAAYAQVVSVRGGYRRIEAIPNPGVETQSPL